MKWQDNVRRVVPYVAGEQPKDSSIIKLNTNECPYPPSPAVSAALMETVRKTDRLRLYPDMDATPLTEALAEKYNVSPDQIFVGVGSDDVLSMCFLTFFTGGGELLFPDITYSFYEVWAQLYRIPYRTIPLKDNFTIDPEDYIPDPGFPKNRTEENAARPSQGEKGYSEELPAAADADRVPCSPARGAGCGTGHSSCGEVPLKQSGGGIIFPNPNAPTGAALPLDSIERIVAANPDKVVIVDEAYIDFGGESALPLLKKYDNLLVVQTFSKSRAMAGARIGFAIGNKELIGYLKDVKFSFNSYTMSYPSILAGTAAVKDDAYFRRITGQIVATREHFEEALAELGFEFPESKANFVFARHPSMSGAELFYELRERKILVRRWEKPRIENHLRITIGTTEQMQKVEKTLREIMK